MVAVLRLCRWGRLFSGSVRGGACGPMGVPGAGGPGRCVCRWAAARPRAVRAASFARRVASKPGQAPPPPTGTAADPSGALHTSGAGLLCVPMGGGPPASQAARLSETAIAFAGAGRASIETAVAFADAKWVFLVQFSGAELMPVSRLPCWGRAVVLLVSMSPRCRASCAKKFALLGLMWA